MSTDVTMQELELETAELLPARETLSCRSSHPSFNVTQAGQSAWSTSARSRRRQHPERHRRARHRRRERRRQRRHRQPVAPARLAPPACCAVPEGGCTAVRRAAPRFPGRPSRCFRHRVVSMHTREEQTRDRSRRARNRRTAGTRLASRGRARARSGAPAGRRGRTARGVPGFRLQPAAVAGAPGRRPGHPDVCAAVPGGLPDRRLPRPGSNRRAGQWRPRPVSDRRPGPLSHHRQAAAPRRRAPGKLRRPGRKPTRCSRCGRGARCCPSARRTPPGRC